MKISIIIPVLNDAVTLATTLPMLLTHWGREEICVVDGGSTDGGPSVAEGFGVRCLRASASGRAVQLNEGAAACAEADVYIFLHADTLLPAEARQAIHAAMDEAVLGGGFARRFTNGGWFLRGTCWLADWRGRFWGWYLGDQAQYVRAEVFHSLGGFPQRQIFEDLEFSRRLARLGKTRLLEPPVWSSARRFEHRGALRQTLRDVRLTLAYLQNKHP